MDENLTQLSHLFDIADEFKHNVDVTYLTTIVPNLIGIGGTLFFHWGFLAAVILNAVLWAPQLGLVMQPLVKHRGSAELAEPN